MAPQPRPETPNVSPDPSSQLADIHPSDALFRPLDSVSWSQSRRWISQEAAARTTYYRMMQRLRHQGFDKSPFIPQNQAELVELRISALSRNIERYDADIRRREKLSKLKKSGIEPDLGPQLFGGKTVLDGLSAVLAIRTCFSGCLHPRLDAENNSTQPDCQAPWPSSADLKGSGRSLPPPRLRAAEEERINGGDRNDNNHCEEYTPSGSLPQIQIRHLPPWLQNLLGKIDDPTQEGADYPVHEPHQSSGLDDEHALEAHAWCSLQASA